MQQNLFRLAVEGMAGNKRSSILRILILLLSFTFAVSTLSITGSLNKTSEEYQYRQYGAWKAAALDAKESDAAMFMESDAVERFGTAQIYGSVIDASEMEITALGTLDEKLIKIGRISLQAGQLPVTEQEIAMEADVLSALGYDYTLGQNIVLRIQKGEQIVEKNYILTGVIREYTDVWSHNRYLLAGAVISAQGGEEIGSPVSYQYFLESDHTIAQLVMEFGKKCGLTKNAAVYSDNRQQSYHFFYIAMILLTTVAAVISVYMVQMQKQARSIILLRSIGGTKRQLQRKLFYETMCEIIPALLTGGIAGAVTTRLLVGLMITVDKENFRVDIPLGLVGAVGVIWMLTIWISKMWVLHLALRQPLTGRLVVQHHAVRKTRRLEQAGFVAVSAVFCIMGLFTYLQSLSFLYVRDEGEKLYDYSLRADGENYISAQEIATIDNIPGIKDTVGIRQLLGSMAFSGMEDSRLVRQIAADEYRTQPGLTADEPFPEGMGIYIYGIRENDVADFLAAAGSQIDREAFTSGEQVIVWFGNGYEMSCESVEDTGLSPGDEIMLQIYGTGKYSENGYEMLETPVIAGQKMAQVGEIVLKDAEEVIGYSMFGNHFYTVVASEHFVWDLLKDSDDTGLVLSNGDFMTGEQGYSSVRIAAGKDATYLNTDYAVSVIAENHGNELDNSREENTAHRQEAERSLVSLWTGSLCISLIMLLLLWNMLSVQGQESRKKYGILRAIGMSEKQVKLSIVKRAAAVNMGAMVIAFGLYGLYLLGQGVWRFAVFTEEENQRNVIELIRWELNDYITCGFDGKIFAGICIGMMWLLFLFCAAAQMRVIKGTPMELLGGERGEKK